MIRRMRTEDAPLVADIFAEHDRTDLPREIGASRRVLFRYQDLYMHLIEAEDDIMGRLYEARTHPIFQKTNDRLGEILTPYSPDWPSMADSRAEIFYTWQAD
jgi:cyclase/tetracenomycin F2 cyclase